MQQPQVLGYAAVSNNGDRAMNTIVSRLYREAPIGSTVVLPKAGTSLENPFVYDASAHDIKALAKRGLVQIVSERKTTVGGEALISELVFTRLG
jgi:hypothetical protein